MPTVPPACSAVAETPEAWPWSRSPTESRDTGSFTVRTTANPVPKRNRPGRTRT